MPPAGRPTRIDLTYRGRESLPTVAGDFSVDRVVQRTRGIGDRDAEWWVHHSLGVPVRGRFADGSEIVLVQLEGPEIVVSQPGP